MVNNYQKYMCVMDTNSIIISHYFEFQDILFGPDTFLTRFDEFFSKYTPLYILRNELNGALSDYEQSFRDMVLKGVSTEFNLSHYTEWETCLRYVEHWLDGNNKNIDEGEKRCLSLSLFLSRSKNAFVYLLSDDYRALDTLNEFMNVQKIGYANTIIDVILNIYARKIFVREEQVMMLLQEYKDIVPKLVGPFTFDTFVELLNKLCRLSGISSHICRQECFFINNG